MILFLMLLTFWVAVRSVVALFLLQQPPDIPRYIASGAITLGLLVALVRVTSIDSPI